MNLILFGFKGCGKTYFGKRAAVDRPFLDTDQLLSEKFGGASPRELFLTWGELKFRLEESLIVKGLGNAAGAIISVGGGTVLDPKNVQILLKIGTMIYLKASFETIQSRGTHPNQALYDLRRPIYESIPATWLDLDRLNESETVAKIRELIDV